MPLRLRRSPYCGPMSGGCCWNDQGHVPPKPKPLRKTWLSTADSAGTCGAMLSASDVPTLRCVVASCGPTWRQQLAPDDAVSLSVWRCGAAWTPTRVDHAWVSSIAAGQAGSPTWDDIAQCPFCAAPRSSARPFAVSCTVLSEARSTTCHEEGVHVEWLERQPPATVRSRRIVRDPYASEEARIARLRAISKPPWRRADAKFQPEPQPDMEASRVPAERLVRHARRTKPWWPPRRLVAPRK